MSTDFKINKIKREILEQHEARLNGLLSSCESKIEELFLLNTINHFESIIGWEVDSTSIKFEPTDIVSINGVLAYAGKGLFRNKEGATVSACSYEVKHHLFSMEVIPQYEVTLNGRKYRLDFLFDIITYQEKAIKICVECDGFDFHGRTIEQVDRDYQKDSDLTTNGILFFRYSGSKIFKSSSFSTFREIIEKIINIASS